MRWLMRCGCGALAGLAAWLALWGLAPLMGTALKLAFDGCGDRGDCAGDAIGRAFLAFSVAIAVWWAATLVAGWLALRLLRVEQAFGAAVLGMAVTMLIWWRAGELVEWTCVPGFAVAAFATNRDVSPAARGGVLAALVIVGFAVTA